MTALDDLRTLTVEEVAELLGVHAETVRRWVREGLLPAARWGGRLRISVGAVREFQAGAGVRPTDPMSSVRRARTQ